MSRIADDFLSRHPELLTEDQTSPRVIRWTAALTAPTSAYFRFRARGFEHVPPGPCLIVANHNVTAPAEILMLLRAWRQALGDRPARGLVHRIAWQLPFRVVPLLPRLGGILAHPRVARAALDRGHAVLVFPGGDLEASRPFSARYRIAFGGRDGFVRLAREAGVPIVPVTICGAHAAFVVPPGMHRLTGPLGVTQLWGFKAVPLTLGFAAVLALAPVALWIPLLRPLLALAFLQALIPWPSRIEAELGEPIWVAPGETDEEAAERVRARMQATMDRLAAGRRTPWG